MLLTAHALTGVALSTVITQPVALAPVAVASHFACDAVPHFGIKGLSFRTPKGFIIGAADFAGALTVLVVCVIAAPGRAALTLTGGLGAMLPDLFYLSEIFFSKRLSGRMGDFHKAIQKYESLPGTAVDVTWGSLLALYLARVL